MSRFFSVVSIAKPNFTFLLKKNISHEFLMILTTEKKNAFFDEEVTVTLNDFWEMLISFMIFNLLQSELSKK